MTTFWETICVLFVGCLVVALADAQDSSIEKCKEICLKYKQMPMLSYSSDCILKNGNMPDHKTYWTNAGCANKLLQSCEPIQGLQPARPKQYEDVVNWRGTCTAAFGTLRGRNDDSDFVFLTVASSPSGIYGKLVASLLQAEIKVVTIGYNFFDKSTNISDSDYVEKKRHKKFFSGFKVVSVYYLLDNCFRRGYVNSRAILMFVDGTDAIFQGTKQGVLQDFLSINKSLVFSTERDMWPATPLTKTLYGARPEAQSKDVFRHLNSGGWIGRVGALIDWYEDWSNPPYVTYKKVLKSMKEVASPRVVERENDFIQLGKKKYQDSAVYVEPNISYIGLENKKNNDSIQRKLLSRDGIVREPASTRSRSRINAEDRRTPKPQAEVSSKVPVKKVNKAKTSKLILEDPQPPRIIHSVEALWNARNEKIPENLPLVYTVSDQFNAAHMFLYEVGDTAIDMAAKLFMSAWIPKHEQFDFFQLDGDGENQRLFSKRTQTYPAILHYNGPARNHWCGMQLLSISNETLLDLIFTDVAIAKNMAFLDDSLNVIPTNLFSSSFLKALVPRHAVLCKYSCVLSDGPLSGYATKYPKRQRGKPATPPPLPSHLTDIPPESRMASTK